MGSITAVLQVGQLTDEGRKLSYLSLTEAPWWSRYSGTRWAEMSDRG